MSKYHDFHSKVLTRASSILETPPNLSGIEEMFFSGISVEEAVELVVIQSSYSERYNEEDYYD